MKTLKIFSFIGATFLLAGCSSRNTPQPTTPAAPVVEQPQNQGYLQGMMNVKKKAADNVQQATDAENQRLQNMLK